MLQLFSTTKEITLKAILITIFFSFFACIAHAQSSSIDAVHKVNNNLYCTAISGDGWTEITFSDAPGKQGKLIYSPEEFKNKFFSIEFQETEHNGGYWRMIGKKEKFDAISETVMKDCIRILNYDGNFDWVKPKLPSQFFAKATVK